MAPLRPLRFENRATVPPPALRVTLNSSHARTYHQFLCVVESIEMVSTRDTGAAGAPPASPKAAAAPPVNSPAAASPRGRARGPSTRGTGHGGGEFASPSPPPVSTRGTGPPVASPPPVPVDDRLRARSEADGAAAAAAAAAERARKLQREKGGAEAAEVARVEAAARAQCDADAAATVRYVARATPAPSTFRAKVLRGPPPLLWVVAGLALLVAVLLGALLHTRDGGSRLSQLAIEASRGGARKHVPRALQLLLLRHL